MKPWNRSRAELGQSFVHVQSLNVMIVFQSFHNHGGYDNLQMFLHPHSCQSNDTIGVNVLAMNPAAYQVW
jgi:hypothetical protein